MKMTDYKHITFILSAGVLLWFAAAKWLVPGIIEQAYLGQSLMVFNNALAKAGTIPLEHYLKMWDGIAVKILQFYLCFGALLLALAYFLDNPCVSRKIVGNSRPESLAAIRILTGLVVLASVIWEDLASSAFLPRSMLEPLGLLKILYLLPVHFESFLADYFALRVFEIITAAFLFLAVVGFWTRVTVPVSALLYLVFAGIFRQYSWFYHTGLVPLYVLAVLSFTPCGDAWSADSWLRQKFSKKSVPSRSPAYYGWCRYACWVALALPYLAAGLSKLRNGGFLWWDPVNFRSILYHTALNPMHFEWKTSLALAPWPDFFIAILALIGVWGEIFFILVLVFRKARLVFPALMIMMHIGILFLQNILFFDLIVLLLVFPICDFLEKSLNASGEKNRIANNFVHPAMACWGNIILIAFLLSIWVVKVEFYPVTAMQMFSGRTTSGKINYYKIRAHYEDGVSKRGYPEKSIGAMKDARYRGVIAQCFDETGREVCREFLLSWGKIFNSDNSGFAELKEVEVQKWHWDFKENPLDPHYGRKVDSYIVSVLKN